MPVKNLSKLVERFKKSKEKSGMRMAVEGQVRKNPLFKELYGELTKKNRDKIEHQSEKHKNVTMGDSHNISNQYQPNRKEIETKHSYHDNNSAPTMEFHERRAKDAKLVSLPLNMKGACCGNCAAYNPYQPNGCEGHCSNPKLNMKVHDSQICRHWNNPDAKQARQSDR